MRVIKSMDIGQTTLFGKQHGMRIGLVVIAAENDDFCAMAAGLLDLHHWRCAGHDDRRGNSEVLGVIGQTLSMIAGRGGNDAGLSLALVHQQQGVERAAFLIGCGELQILKFEKNFCPAEFRQRDTLERWRVDDPALDPVMRGFHIVEIEGWQGAGLDIIHIASAPNASGHRGKQ